MPKMLRLKSIGEAATVTFEEYVEFDIKYLKNQELQSINEPVRRRNWRATSGRVRAHRKEPSHPAPLAEGPLRAVDCPPNQGGRDMCSFLGLRPYPSFSP